MTEHIALLEKEIKELQNNYVRAKARLGVKEDELANLEKKLRLKCEILSVVVDYVNKKKRA